ncbi:MAG: hypothetical protein CFE31_04655 [Rhizobiales bacterium PAR1]|nr:MAG: hypothetical protein CFE31_04655 [Rhizobiales bacterium PAR1]
MHHQDFWVSSGHHLVDRDEGGGLVLTDDFLKAYLARPELVPPPEACPVERGLHAQLLASPRAVISTDEIALMADEDARENLALFLAFRDRLLAEPTLEAAYLSLVRKGMGGTPPLFIQHLTHLIARNAFDGVSDAHVLRAAEGFWRAQRVTFHEGSVLLADQEAIESHEHDRDHSPLLNMLGGPAVSELEVLTAENAAGYAARSDAHDLVFDLTDPKQGRKALGAAMMRWISHLIGIEIAFEPVERFFNERFAWFLALDTDGTAIGNKVWQGEALSETETSRILALYAFTLPDHPRIMAEKRGRRAFAILGSGADRLVRIKPQNLIAGLPLGPDSA